MGCVLQLGPTWKALALWTSGQVVFTCATWEEYYTGSLELPLINGPTEGILIAICLKIFTAIQGPDFWLQEFIPGFQNNTIFIIITILGAIPTVAIK